MKILLDTDIGTDSDDALCLAYLLNKPECELLGITTVGCQATQRAEIVDSLCHHFGRDDIPIAAGADRPFTPNYYWDDHRLSYYQVAEQWPARRSYARGEALGLMQRIIRENPGEVVLVAVGPLTNVALLAVADPEAMKLLKGVFIMGGFDNDRARPRTECNIMLDAASASATFAAEGPTTHIVSASVTRGHHVSGDEATEHFSGDRLAPVLACVRGWEDRKGSPGAGLHDPITVMAMFHPEEVCRWQRGRVTVKIFDHDPTGRMEFDEDQVTGVTFFDRDEAGPHLWGVQADSEFICREFFARVSDRGQ